MDLPRTPSFRLDDKHAFVAGGSRGIGLGCAVALAEAGASVTIAARNGDEVKQTAQVMRAAGFNIRSAVLDVTDVTALQTTLTDGFTDTGLDVLCNSAGLARHSPALETTPTDYDAMMGVNVKAAYFLAQTAAHLMTTRGNGGSIIQISSQMAHVGGIDRAVYCATKHAVEGMTKSMAIEWGKAGIRVNSICPTFIRTSLTRPTFENPERLKWIMEKIKLPRVGEISDIMGAVQFLASDASAMVTGTSLMIDGGWTAG